MTGPRIRTRVEGASELDRVLKQLPRRVRERVLVTSVRAGANIVKKEAIVAAPESGEPSRVRRGKDYGKLRDNIRVRRLRDTAASVTLVVTIGRAFWGMLQEFGTRFQAARPWMRPAFDRSKQRALDAIGKSLGRGVEREAKKLAGPQFKRRRR